MNYISAYIFNSLNSKHLVPTLFILSFFYLGTACDESSTVITNNEVATCDNGILDGDEDDIDCGGSCENSCGSVCQDAGELGSSCIENSACLSMNCLDGLCAFCPEGKQPKIINVWLLSVVQIIPVVIMRTVATVMRGLLVPVKKSLMAMG